MKKFIAHVVDKSGNKRKIVESAISKHLLETELSDQGYFIVKIEDFREPVIELVSSKISKKQLLDLSYNIYSLLDFGLDINQAFTILQKVYAKGTLSDFVKDISESLNKGETLYSSIRESKQSRYFDSFILTMISSGEVSGKLSDSFRLIFRYLKNNQKLADKIIGSLIYPIILFTMSFLAMNLLFLMILPLFKEMYASMDFEPRALIRVLFSISDLFTENLMAYLISLLVLGVTVYLVIRIPQTRARLMAVLKKLPIVFQINRLQKKINISFSLEILLRGGATLEEALYKLNEIEIDKNMKAAYEKSINILKNGGTIKEAFKELSFFSGRDLSIIEISESVSRSLDGFEKIYQDGQVQLENYFETMIRISEPVILIFIGLFVFFVLYLVVSPTLDMLNSAEM